jgi:heat shock protein HtpX
MTRKLYTAAHYAGAGLHYAVAAGLLATAAMIAPPVVLGASLVIVGGVHYGMNRVQKNFFETMMKKHDDDYDYAPELPEIVRDLYKASGLKSENYPLYDMAADESALHREEKAIDSKRSAVKHLANRGLAFIMNSMGQTPNAAAVRLNKPVIMISKPLLKLLDTAEEKAVLAHEFAHAAARHNQARAPMSFALGVAGLSLGLVTVGAFLGAGWIGVPAAIVGGLVAGAVAKKAVMLVTGSGKICGTNDVFLAPGELRRKQGIATVGKYTTTIGAISIATAFNPFYLPAVAASKAVSIAAKGLTARFSRHHEFQADRGAVVLGADPLALATALRKITLVSERSIEAVTGTPAPERGMLTRAWRKATATHPSVDDRIRRLGAMARRQKRSEEEIAAALTGPIEVDAAHNLSFETVRKILAR